MTDVVKHSHLTPVSQEILDDARAMAEAQRRWNEATPEQRAQWTAEADAKRQTDRDSATPTPLTLGTLLAKLDWPRAYAEHYVQPYCECDTDFDGSWLYCQHARDEGLVP